MNEPTLTAEAKEAIRSYMLRLIALPSLLVAIIAFVSGFLVNDVAKQGAFNKAYQDAAQNIYTLTREAADAVSKANQSKEDLEKLVVEVEDVVEQSDTLREKLKTVRTLTQQSEQFVTDVSTDIMNRSDFHNTLAGSFGDRVTTLENEIDAFGKGECSWVSVGYDKSHRHEAGEWCSKGSFIRQIDIDGCGDPGNCPIIRSVQCCKVLP